MVATPLEYLVAHGGAGAIGRFAVADEALLCRRGDRVVVRSQRGVELGVVLCPATPRHARLLPGSASGQVLRRAGAEDEQTAERQKALGHLLFEDCRRLVTELKLPFEVLDVEVLLDGVGAIVQHLRWADCDYSAFVEALSGRHAVEIWMEDLALPAAAREEEAHGGCGKPDCGRAEGGGCSTCGSGGCSSCGGGKVDMRSYFAHLRAQMEQNQRTPLL